MRKLFCMCTVLAGGMLLAAADIDFKWDVSGSFMQQLTLLVSIIAGSWVLVSFLQLFR